jgi:16S rRNA (cytosine967-C5)-methyltransferase
VALDPIGADEIGGLAEAITAEGCVRTLPSHGAAWASVDEPRRVGLDGFFAARLVRLRDN